MVDVNAQIAAVDPRPADEELDGSSHRRADAVAELSQPDRRRVGCRHQRRADPPVVPAGLGRPAPRRQVPARRQRRRRGAGVRAPGRRPRALSRHMGVRRRRDVAGVRLAATRRRGDHRRARAHRGGRRHPAGILGAVRPRRDRHRLGRRLARTRAAPLRARSDVRPGGREAWVFTDEGKAFYARRRRRLGAPRTSRPAATPAAALRAPPMRRSPIGTPEALTRRADAT